MKVTGYLSETKGEITNRVCVLKWPNGPLKIHSILAVYFSFGGHFFHTSLKSFAIKMMQKTEMNI